MRRWATALISIASLAMGGCAAKKKLILPPPPVVVIPKTKIETPPEIAISLPKIDIEDFTLQTLPPENPEPQEAPPPKPVQARKPAPQPAPEVETPPVPTPAAPRLSEVLTENSRRQYETEFQNLVNGARAAVNRAKTAGHNLNARQRETVQRIETYLEQAEQSKAQDLVYALALAHRADAFGQELLRSLQ